MKVIGQLIKYFQSRGALDQDQLDYLAEHGFLIRPETDDADDLVNAGEGESPTPILDSEPHGDEARFDKYPVRRKGGGQRKPDSIEGEDLADWLTDHFPAWQSAMAGFEQIAARVSSPC